MIDHLRAFSKKAVWLKPFLLISTAAAFVVFCYVVFFGEGAETDVYIIPSVVGVLWSLLFLFLLAVFPYVPPKPSRQKRLPERLKVRLARGLYHIGSLMFCAISATALWLTLRLLNVWHADF
jgi:fatty acid desaturase